MTKNSRNFILVALALLPVTAFGTIMLLLFSQEQQKSMETLLEQTAASTVSAVQHSITNDISVLQALANDHALNRGDYADFDDAARRVLETRPAWLRIILSDRQRHIVNTGVSFGSPMRLCHGCRQFRSSVRDAQTSRQRCSGSAGPPAGAGLCRPRSSGQPGTGESYPYRRCPRL